MQQKYVNYLTKVDHSTEALLKRYQKLLDLVNVQKIGDLDEEDESAGINRNNLNLIATSTLSIESNVSGMIQILEELMMITRALKENWLLNRLPNGVSELGAHYNEATIADYENQNTVLKSVVNELIDRIAKVDYTEDLAKME